MGRLFLAGGVPVATFTDLQSHRDLLWWSFRSLRNHPLSMVLLYHILVGLSSTFFRKSIRARQHWDSNPFGYWLPSLPRLRFSEESAWHFLLGYKRIVRLSLRHFGVPLLGYDPWPSEGLGFASPPDIVIITQIVLYVNTFLKNFCFHTLAY